MTEEEFLEELRRRKETDVGLNNFHSNCPGGYQVMGCYDSPTILDKLVWKNNEKISEFKKNKTPREFFEDFRQAILSAGMGENEPRELWEKHNWGEITHEDYIDLMAPIYINLRRMGYKCGELTS